MTGIWVVGAVLALTLTFGWYRRGVDGRASTEPVRSDPEVDFGAELGRSASLIQFSSEFCAPCRTASRLLAEVTEEVPGVQHVELDVADSLDLVERLGISRTPTVLLLDGAGKIRQRIVGVPRPEVIRQALDEVRQESRVA